MVLKKRNIHKSKKNRLNIFLIVLIVIITIIIFLGYLVSYFERISYDGIDNGLKGELSNIKTNQASNTYYIDDVLGNDNNPGTSQDQAWKSIGKVNSFNFQPGDQILFKRGGTFREQLNVPSSGTYGNNIVFGAYGTGVKPIISAGDVVSGWTIYNGNIYVTDLNVYTEQLYVDSEYYDIAYYPNNGFLIATANLSDNGKTIIDSNLNITKEQIIGASVMAKSLAYRVIQSTAIDYNPLIYTITLNPTLYATLQKGSIFYLQNMSWMLDQPGEWYYNTSTGKIYLWIKGNEDPNNHLIEISNRTNCINITGKNYITIQDLDLRKANSSNIYVSSSNGINIEKVSIYDGLNGINLTNSTNCSLTNNILQNTLMDGIDSGISYDFREKVTNINITNNIINNSGNMGMPRTVYAGINVGNGGLINAESIIIKNNSVNNSGYIGIMFFGNLITVQYNKVDESCLVLGDCGGIYTSSWQNIGGTIPSNNSIISNTVTNVIGDDNGANGIYLDGVTYDCKVLNNTVVNASVGIFSNDGHNNTIIGNKIYRSRWTGLSIVSGSFKASAAQGGLAKNNIIKNNVFDESGINYVVYLQNGGEHQALDFGIFDNNKYCHPNTNSVVLTNLIGQSSDPLEYYNPGNNYSSRYFNLSQWQNYSGLELNSTDTNTSCTIEYPIPEPFCGDGVCNNYESCSSCSSDCGGCPNNNNNNNDGHDIVIAGGPPKTNKTTGNKTINIPINQTEENKTVPNNQSGDIEIPIKTSDIFINILKGSSVVLLIVVIILFIVRHFIKKNESNNSYV